MVEEINAIDRNQMWYMIELIYTIILLIITLKF
jgi:hypothetical protein